MDPNPQMKVNVWMITYNQEAYIGQAIESVLMQKTTFPVEMVIGEDGSRDNTRAVIQDYCTRYPGRIRLLPDVGNLGMMGNMIRTLKACNAKYVAMLEGDDYWIDEHKLQKQFDFMEAHPDCSLCFHATEHRFPDPSRNYLQSEYKVDTWVGLREVILYGGSFIPTFSMFYRGEYIQDLPDWLTNAEIGDYPLGIQLALNGRVRFMADVMGVYRRQAVGAWSSGWTWWRHKTLVFGNNRMLLRVNKATRGRHFRIIALTLLQSNWGLFKAMIYSIGRPAYRYIKRRHVQYTIP